MNILIVGLGYAGHRFFSALRYVEQFLEFNISLNVAYVGREKQDIELTYFSSVSLALGQFRPDLVIVTVNDQFHANILNQLKNFNGFVICEKPLANSTDDLLKIENNLRKISGFCFDLIERYSEAAIKLKEYVRNKKLNLIRAHFHWGKNRINDYRPTCGVTSEVIHPLDNIRYIKGSNEPFKFDTVSGTRSDFSISGDNVLDSVMLSGHLGNTIFTGYSSFVNPARKREIDLTFLNSDNKLIYAKMVFDTPEWDMDTLKIWENTKTVEKIHCDLETGKQDRNPQLKTIEKLTKLVSDVLYFIIENKKPSQTFPCLLTAIQLQKMLNKIESMVRTQGKVNYVTGPEREFLVVKGDLERLG